MKKILALCLVVTLLMCALVGCNQQTFDGNYQQANAGQVETFAKDAAASGKKVKPDKEDYRKGYSITLDAEMESGELSSEIEIKIHMIEVDGQMKSSGGVKLKSKSTEFIGEFWYVDGAMYLKSKQGPDERKVRAVIEFEEYIAQLNHMQYFEELGTLVDYLHGQPGVEYFIEETSENTKIKVSVEQELPANDYVNTSTDAEYYFVFTKDKDIEACKISLSNTSQGAFGGFSGAVETEIELEAKPWSGNINTPKNLDEFSNGAIDLNSLINQISGSIK